MTVTQLNLSGELTWLGRIVKPGWGFVSKCLYVVVNIYSRSFLLFSGRHGPKQSIHKEGHSPSLREIKVDTNSDEDLW